MPTTASVEVKIGATLASTFGAAFGNATRQVKQVEKAMGMLASQRSQLRALVDEEERAGVAMNRLRDSAQATGAKFLEAKAKTKALRDEIASLGVATEGQAKSLAKLEKAELSAKARWMTQQSRFNTASSAFGLASANAAGAREKDVKIGATLEAIEGRRTRLMETQQKIQERSARRQQLSSGLGGTLARLGLAFGAEQLIFGNKEYEDKLILASSQAQFKDKEMAKLGQVVTALQRETGQSRENLVDLFAERVGLGEDPLAVMKSLKPGGLMQTAYKMNAQDVGQYQFALATSFGITPEEMMKAQAGTSVMGKLGSFELRNMAHYLPQLGAIAKLQGVRGMKGLFDTVATLEVVKRGAADPEQAVANFSMLAKDIYNAKVGKRMQETLGLNARKVIEEGQKRGDTPVMAIAKAFNASSRIKNKDGSMTKDAIWIINQIFRNQQSQKAIGSLIAPPDKQALSGLDEFKRVRAGAETGQDVVAEDAAARMKGTELKLQMAKDQIKTAVGEISESLKPLTTKVLDKAVDLAPGVTKFVQEHGTAVRAFAVVGATLVGLRATLWGLEWAWLTVTTPFLRFKAATEAFKLSGSVLDAMNTFITGSSTAAKSTSALADSIGAVAKAEKDLVAVDAATKIEGIGGAAGGAAGNVGALATATRLLGNAVLFTAAAYGGWQLGKWLRENVPGVKGFGDYVGDQIGRAGGYSVAEWFSGAGKSQETADATRTPIAEMEKRLARRGITVNRRGMSDGEYRAELEAKIRQQAGMAPDVSDLYRNPRRQVGESDRDYNLRKSNPLFQEKIGDLPGPKVTILPPKVGATAREKSPAPWSGTSIVEMPQVRQVPAAPLLRTDGSSAASGFNPVFNTTINVTAQPGADGNAVAKQMADVFDRKYREILSRAQFEASSRKTSLAGWP